MDQIKKEHIISAIQEIKANPSLRKGRASTTFDLIYEGADYPCCAKSPDFVPFKTTL